MIELILKQVAATSKSVAIDAIAELVTTQHHAFLVPVWTILMQYHFDQVDLGFDLPDTPSLQPNTSSLEQISNVDACSLPQVLRLETLLST